MAKKLNKFVQASSVIWLGPLLYFAGVEALLWIKKPALLFSSELLLNRLLFLGVFIGSLLLGKHLSNRLHNFTLTLILYALLTLLYQETATLNELFYPVIDQKLMHWDQWLFGFQPALEFSRTFPNPILSELLFFGYFSYYLMPLVILFLLFNYQPGLLRPFGFTLIFSFLTYYFLFILFPAVGPQFYWKSPENSIPAQGIFGQIIQFIQANGEAKTAAFIDKPLEQLLNVVSE